MYEFCNNYEQMFENIVGSAYSYVASSKVKALVIGMSGGIDSALTAALAQEVVKRLDNKVKLVGRIIDIHSNNTEMQRAVNAARVFCHTHQHHDLVVIYKDMVKKIVNPANNSTRTRIRLGNVKARLRMIELYDLANETKGMVLSTDNYTEYLLGFWTLHGDVGDFGMIQNLWKTEVYGLAEYLVNKFNLSGNYVQADALKACINAVPTDGLGVTDSDFDQILPGYDKNMSPKEVYKEIDNVLSDILVHKHNISDKHSKVVERYKATEFKRLNPFNIPRNYIVYIVGKKGTLS